MPILILYVLSVILLMITNIDGTRSELFNGELSIWIFFGLLAPLASLGLLSFIVILSMLWMFLETPVKWIVVKTYILVMRIWYYGRLIFMSRERRKTEYEKTRSIFIELKRLQNRLKASLRSTEISSVVESKEEKKANNDLLLIGLGVLIGWGLFGE